MGMSSCSGRQAAARAVVLSLLSIGAFGALGCSQTAAPKKAGRKVEQAKVAATPRPAPARSSRVAKIDASSDAVLAEGKLQIAAGAPSDAEVRREIKLARKAGIVLPSGNSAASFENSPSSSAEGTVQAEAPEAPWNPRAKLIATWIIPILGWAHEHGWAGTVTSGYRTYYEQAQLNAAGAFSALAGLSNHETTKYPGGAVDVTSPAQLSSVLQTYPGPVKLVGGVLGPIDPEHFSATGD